MNEELEKEQEQSGVSFREIFNALFKWKWLALAVVVICTLLTYILTSFVINPTRTNYSYSFYVMFPNSTSETYPDGTPFDYRDIISSSNLVATKESDEEFSNIDVERMEKKGDISIGRQMDTLWDLDNITDTNIQYEYKYTVTVKSSYFKNGDIAAKFITSLAQYPLDYAIQVTENLNYKVNLEAYKNPSNTRYSERLNYLLEERSFILNQLDSLINIYDSNYPVNGNSLSYWRSQADFAFSSALEDELKNDLDNYSYVYKENEDSILTEIALLERENLVSENIRSELKTQREELLKSFTDGAILTLELESYNTKITELTEQIEKKENEIEVLYQSIYYEKNAEGNWVKLSGTKLQEKETEIAARKANLEEKLEAVYGRLDNVADTCKSVNVAVYTKESRLQVLTTGVAVENGLSSMLASAVAFVISLAVIWIIAYGIERSRKNNNPPKEVNTTEGAQNQEND